MIISLEIDIQLLSHIMSQFNIQNFHSVTIENENLNMVM